MRAETSTEHDTPRPVLSVLTPAFNEEENLPLLYERIRDVADGIGVTWEWVVVDDHSSDKTFAVLCGLAARDPRVRAFRLARNGGAHVASICAFDHVRGKCVVGLAGDLQDPPEIIPPLIEKWREGAVVVSAVRRRREGEKTSVLAFSRLYYFLLRNFVGIRNTPTTGSDAGLIDRVVVDALTQFRDTNVDLNALIMWMGFPRTTIEYDKHARAHGKSGWTLEKKLKLVVDSVTSFTYLPLRLMSYVGGIVALLGFLYAGQVIRYAITGDPVRGWASLMVVTLVMGGIQMVMMGVLGEYLWRTLDAARGRPLYIIEAATDIRPVPPPLTPAAPEG